MGDGVRKWIADRGLSRGHTEGCVLHLAATINAAAGHQAQFKAGSVAAAIYAIPDPLNLGLSLAATEAVIDELEARVPGAYTALLPQNDSENGVRKPPGMADFCGVKGIAMLS